MCYYVYSDHAQYTIKTYAKIALFPLILILIHQRQYKDECMVALYVHCVAAAGRGHTARSGVPHRERPRGCRLEATRAETFTQGHLRAAAVSDTSVVCL